jgi:HK97 family phage major capsid protein
VARGVALVAAGVFDAKHKHLECSADDESMEKDLTDLTARHVRNQNSDLFFKWNVALGVAGGDPDVALRLVKQQITRAQFAALESWRTKAPVGALGTTTAGSGAEMAPIVGANDFGASVKASCALDRGNPIRVPLHTQVPLQTATANFGYVALGSPLPASRMTTDHATLDALRIGGIRLVTEEGLKFSTPGFANPAQADSIRALTLAVDRSAWDPDIAASAGVNPASLTNAASEITFSGNSGETLEGVARDLHAAVSQGTPSRASFVMNGRLAVYLSALRSTLGFSVFPSLGASGGTILGVPAIVTLGMPDILVCADFDGVFIADDGVEMEVSRAASIRQDDAPASPAQHVSLFQSHMWAIKLERRLNFARRADAVSFARLPISGSPAWL